MSKTLVTEWRATGPFEVRAAGDGLTFEGYASVFDEPYAVTDWLGEYTEVVRSGAFKRTLDHGADVRLLVNHEGLPLARTKSGTLALEEDSKGLLTRASLDPASPTVQSLKSAMQRGDADQMSMAFRVTRQDWAPDYEQRDILEVQLFDVSVVTFPASPTTSASLRSATIARYGSDAWSQVEAALRDGMSEADAARFVRSLADPARDLRALRIRSEAALIGVF